MIINSPLFLEFMDFVNLFNQPSKQKKIPKSNPTKLNQTSLTQLTAILTNADVSFGKLLLDSISNIIYEVLQMITESEMKNELIQSLLNHFHPDHQKPFSVSRSTVQEHLPSLTKHQLDQHLEQDYQKQMQLRNSHKAKSSQVTLAIDYSHDRTTSKYRNNQHSHVRIGQRKVWEQGFNYASIYDATHQMFLGLIHHNSHKVKRERRAFQPWITHLQSKIKAIEDLGSNVALIEADRGYFDSEFFALSHLGRLKGFNEPHEFIRVMTPRKFTQGKEQTMWQYLLSDDVMQVSLQEMKLSYYSPQKLLQECEDVGLHYTDGLYSIPVIQVVLVDEYQTKSNRSFEDVRIEAKTIEKEIIKTTEHLRLVEDQYFQLQQQFKKKPRRLKYRKNQRRKIFKNSTEKILYCSCYEIHDFLLLLEERKQNILCNTVFFYLSSSPQDDPLRYTGKFIKFAKDYHERWGIENGFRDAKRQFLHRSRSQKPTRRQLYWLQGLMLYNRWQTHKLLDMLVQERDRVSNIVPWESRRPHIRKKLEKSVRTDWTAKGYILRLWEIGLKICLKSILTSTMKS
jgi:hypothetical protein